MTGDEFDELKTMRWNRDQLRARVLDGDGLACPCCNQFVKVYRRTLNSGMAARLIVAYRVAGLEYFDYRTTFAAVAPLLVHGADFAKLRWWGLAESDGEIRDDGSLRSGRWRVTESGGAFVRRELTVAPAVYLLNNVRLRSLEPDEDPIGIVAALRNRFNYEDLMAGRS
jgi:hypothetical protein